MNIFNKLRKANNLYESIRPAIWITYFLGLEPSDPFGNENSRLKILGYFFTFSQAFSYLICMFVSLKSGKWLMEYVFLTKYTKSGEICHPITAVFLMLTIFLFAIIKRKTLRKLIYKIENTDKILLILGLKVNHQKFLSIFWTFSIIVGIINFLGFWGSYGVFWNAGVYVPFAVFVSYLVPNLQMTIVILKLRIFLNLIYFRIVMLNEILNNMHDHLKFTNQNKTINQTSDKPIEIKKKSLSRSVYHQCTVEIDKVELKTATIRKATKIYDLLCDACEIVDDHFTYQMLVIIGISFIYIVFDGYYILVALLYRTENSDVGNKDFLIFFCIQMFLYIVIILGIVESVNKTIKQSRLSLTLIHKMLNLNEDIEIQDCLRNFISQIVNRPITFTAAGLFNLDRTLYFTISGATTTYLIVLVQFSSPQNIALPGLEENSSNNQTVS